MLSIVGGCYRENCLEPIWDEQYGSGLRAAVAVSEILHASLGASPELHTWASQSERRYVELQCKTFDISANVYERSDSIQFQWDYGLAKPRIFPDPSDIIRIPDRTIRVKNAVVFGILEDIHEAGQGFRAKVTANRLVYDPQAEENAVPWKESGHSCKSLAIVANLKEATAMCKRLTLPVGPNTPRPQVLAQALVASQEAEVVVVKNGAEGAFIATPNDVQHIPSYKTDKVFPFGSGDIFTAVFGAYWAELGIDPVLAAQRASVAAAVHSSGPILPIPKELDEIQTRLEALTTKRVEGSKRPQVYLAGPLFTFPQRWFIGEVRLRLSEQGVRVFSPYHDVGVGKSCEDIVREDLAGLDESAVVFAILDGLDSGTLFEIGYAVAKNIPVIGFRQTASESDLTMLRGSSSCRVYGDLPSAIYHAAWAALEQ